MKHLYVVPTDVYEANEATIQFGGRHSARVPGDPTQTLLVVEAWTNATSQDAFEALPGVRAYPPWSWSQPAPAELAPAVATLDLKAGVSGAVTLEELFHEIRTKHWPAWRW